MGQQSNAQKRENLKQYREQRRREAMEKQKRQNRIVLGILIGTVVVVAALVLIPLIRSAVNNGSEDTYLATDYVRMDISYTDSDGVARQGSVILELYGNLAPITVQNFTDLVGQKFYDGLTFHRVIENFMIQGGDPEGDGTGDSGQRIKGEFSSNGVTNDLKHERGVISMARSSAYNSASCQFFIMHKTSSHLDGEYAAFGRVISGMETVDAIAALDTDSNDKPLEQVTITAAYLISADQIPNETTQSLVALLPEDRKFGI